MEGSEYDAVGGRQGAWIGVRINVGTKKKLPRL